MSISVGFYSVILTPHYPNVNAVALQLSEGDHVHEQQLVVYAKTCVQPAFNYFKAKFDDDLVLASILR